MREPFNTTCDVYAGPATAFPGAYRGSFLCRYVREDAIQTVGPGAPTIFGYVTIQAYQPVGMWGHPFFGLLPGLADEIVIPSGGMVRLAVLYTDVIEWRSQPTYYRAYLISLPLPAIGPYGGLLAGGAGGVEFSRFIDGSGGMLGDSAATWWRRRAWAGSGGLLGDSAATYSRRSSLVGSGGVLGDSAASMSFAPGVTWRIVDHFQVSNQTNAGRTPDTIDVPGTTWNTYTGTMSVVSDALTPTAYSGSAALCHISNHQPIVSMSASIILPTSTSRQIAILLFRYNDQLNYWWAQIEYSVGGVSTNNLIYLQQMLAGVGYFRATPMAATILPGTPYTMAVTDDGTNMVATVSGVSATYSGTSLNFAQECGVWILSLDNGASGSPIVDDFFAK